MATVSIGDALENIGDLAFQNCNGLTSITFGISVKNIGSSAFYGCTGLTSITIPESVITIGSSAFYGCNSLISINIPDDVKSIGDRAFYDCSSLESIYIGASVSNIGYQAFYNCISLTKSEFANIESLCKISYASENANPLYWTHSIYINDEEVTSIDIPDGITSISNYAFYSCDNITSVIIPTDITNIGQYAFSGCGLTSVTIEPNVYVSNTGLCFTKDNIVYKVLSKNSIEIQSGHNCSGDLVIPKTITAGNTFSVTSIGDNAFYDCQSLTSVTIPNTVTSIGQKAFNYCWGLQTVFIPNTVTSMGETVFNCYRPNAQIYCEAESQPSYWNSKWNSVGVPVIWGYKSTENQGEENNNGENNNGGENGNGSQNSGNGNASQNDDNQNGNGQNGNEGGENNNPPTAVSESATNNLQVYAHHNTIIVENATDEICVYNAMGALVGRDAIHRVRAELQVNGAGVYIVKVGTVAKRVMISD